MRILGWTLASTQTDMLLYPTTSFAFRHVSNPFRKRILHILFHPALSKARLSPHHRIAPGLAASVFRVSFVESACAHG